MDGLKLAHAVRDRWPPIKIIVTSGRDRVGPHDLPDGGRFFAKPYESGGNKRHIARLGAVRPRWNFGRVRV